MDDYCIGQFVRRDRCRFCNSQNLERILDFGDMPLAGGFLEETQIPREKYYPLDLNFCHDCTLVQVSNVVSAEVLFKEKYFFFSSAIATLVEHFKDFAGDIKDGFLRDRPDARVLEIGCNDGVLLKPLSKLGVKCIGVDPATNVVQKIDDPEISVINDFFGTRVAKEIVEHHGRVDAVLSSFSFAHIDNMADVMSGITEVLADDGVFVFEIYYLRTLIEEMQYDMIYHEHMNYYSLLALQAFLRQYGMQIFDVRYIPGVRAGSVRFYAQYRKTGKHPVQDAVKEMADNERTKGYDTVELYSGYAEQVKRTKDDMIQLLERLKQEGKRVIGYGASGRGTVIMNYCGIDSRYIDYVVDDAPAKHGYYTPGTHLPIKPWEQVLASDPPDYIILFAWAFTNEVIQKRQDYLSRGGKFIVPLPEVQIVSA